MKNYKTGLIVFLFLATIISLFPPFEWGNKNIKTERERIKNRNILESLPIKEYDFLFSSNKKLFPVGGYQISEILHEGDKLRIDTSDIWTNDVVEGKNGIDTFFYKFHESRVYDWDRYSKSDKKGNYIPYINPVSYTHLTLPTIYSV